MRSALPVGKPLARGVVAVCALAAGLGCEGASPSNGLGAYFRASGAQFVEGAIVLDPNATGPEVHTIGSNNNRLYPGVQNKAVSGTVDNHGAAVVIGLAGDSGHWILPVGGEDTANPPDLTFATRGSFSPTLQAGAYQLVYRAVDQNGVMGPSSIQPLTLAATPVEGMFVISLEWDGPADLDLHVVAPATGGTGTVEIWSKKRNSLAARVQGVFTPEEIAAAGILDFDSNTGCVYDGRDNENVIWTQYPPAGHYIVRVDASSLCGAPTVRWRATASLQGTLLESFGQLGDVATTIPHVAGAGLTVLDFNTM